MTDPADRVGADADFRRLWSGLATSQFGSAVGSVAVPVVAVTVLGVSALQLSLLVASAAVATVLLAFPVGELVEFRRKRPLMIGADVARAVSLGSVPIAAAFGVLSYPQLVVVSVVNAVAQLIFTSAGHAHLRALVSRRRVVDANAKLESTLWLSVSVGPATGGALVALLGAAGTLVVDAVSFLVSGTAIRRLRRPEPTPPRRAADRSRRAELTAGLGFVRTHPQLRRFLLSWVAFAGAVSMLGPLSTVYYLSELRFSPVEYGLLLGVPSLGGFFGARATRSAVARWGPLRVVKLASLLRSPWPFVIPLAPAGTGGLILCGAATFLLLTFSGLANSAMNGYRQQQTPEPVLARVSTLWVFATTVAQPVFVIVGGVLSTLMPLRAALVVAAVLMTAPAFLLPRPDRAGPRVSLRRGR